MVGNNHTALRKGPVDTPGDTHDAQNSLGEFVQPICSLTRRRRPLDSKLRRSEQEYRKQLHNPDARSKESKHSKSHVHVLPTHTVYPVDVPHSSPPVHHNWFYRRAILPILALLRMGATPRTLAWSIAVGLMVGLNPIIGTTTILCLAAAFSFRLNPVASQIANHAMFPFELLLVVPFIRLGSLVFHTAPMPLSPKLFLLAARTAPLALTRQLWLWEWHAFVLWIAISIMAAPLIAVALTPLLQRLLSRVQHHQYPIVPLQHEEPLS